MAVTAPFQFARIPRAVWFPEWGPLVSHDVPFADGYSGTIDIEIEAMTPLLIGGERREAKAEKAGEVWPVQLPDGTYAIPGSSLQGMIRNILEIACFGKLGPWVDERRFGIRDLTPAAKPFFQDRLLKSTGHDPINVQPLVKAAWLRKKDGKYELKQCEFARIEFAELATIAGNMNRWAARSDVNNRYGLLGNGNISQTLFVEDAATNPTHLHRMNRDGVYTLSIAYSKACVTTQPNTIARDGKIVLSGNTGMQNPAKHMEFFFFNNTSPTPLEPEFSDRFDEFQEIHEPNDGRPKNPNWTYYRDTGYPGEQPFSKGGWMPIFYLADPIDNSKIESFGLAFMFKLAHKNNTHEMLNNSSDQHLDKSKYDLPSLIFGAIGDSSDKTAFSHSVKRRASFDWAVAEVGAKSVEAQYDAKKPNVQAGENKFPPTRAADATVLLGPKPSYFPIYVRQPVRPNDRLKRDNNRRKTTESYSTYTPPLTGTDITKTRPELAGAKIWPASNESLFFNLPRAPTMSGNNADKEPSSKATHVHLHALDANTKFTTKLHVHNLRRCELGALLWALTFGDEKSLQGEFGALHHRIGMGKPYGMGEIKLRLGCAILFANDKNASALDLADFVKEFQTTMKSACALLAKKADRNWKKGGQAVAIDAELWNKTAQVEALKRAADPEKNSITRYMKLSDFDADRNDGYFLKPYADYGFELEHKPPQPQRAAIVGGQTAGYPFVEDAPIRRKRDGAEGFLREKAHGNTWKASFGGAASELIFQDDVEVYGPPDE